MSSALSSGFPYGPTLDSDERFRLVMESSPVGTCIMSPEGRFTEVNAALCAMLGRDADALKELTLVEVTHPADLAICLGLLNDVLEDRIPSYRMRKRYVRPGGSVVWADASVACIRNPDRTVRSLISQVVDITAQVAAEQKLLELGQARQRDLERLRATLDSLTDAHVLLEPVRDKRAEIVDFVYADANKAACDLAMRPRDELLGASIRTLHGEAAQGLLAMCLRVIQTAEPLILDDYRYARDPFGHVGRRYDIRAVRCGEGLSITWRDVTDRYNAARALADSEEHFRMLAENLSDVVVRVDPDWIVQWVSPSVVRTLRWRQDEFVGRQTRDLVHADDLSVLAGAQELVASGKPAAVRLRLLGANDSYRWVELHAKGYFDEYGMQTGAVASFRNVDAEVAYEQELRWRAHYDELTGLFNRREVLDRVAGLSRYTLRTGSEAAVLFVDVDKLKDVNDTYGHAVGDELLRAVGQRLAGSIRESDVAGRIGGDEFLAILRGVHGIDDALVVAEKIRAAISEPLVLHSVELTPSASIGVTMSWQGESVESLLSRADEGLLRAKKTGRNQVIFIP